MLVPCGVEVHIYSILLARLKVPLEECLPDNWASYPESPPVFSNVPTGAPRQVFTISASDCVMPKCISSFLKSLSVGTCQPLGQMPCASSVLEPFMAASQL